MENPKWWHVAVAAIAVTLSGMLLLVTDITLPRMLGAFAALAVFTVAWYSIGWRSWRSPSAAVAFTVVLIAASGAAASFYPAMAIIQCVAFPLIWVIAPNLRASLVANVALALSVGLGLVVSQGFAGPSIAQAAFTAALSLGFSLALGLWITRIFALSAEKQRLIDELRAAEGQLAALHRDAGVASERERLSRELHDTIAQSLTGLVMLVQGARRDLDAAKWDDARSALALVESSARDALVETRVLVASGAAVEVPGGIIPALHRLAERFERETGVSVRVDAAQFPRLDRSSEVVLLRCAQEALANVRKHAKAGSVILSATGNGESIELRVADDGVGFSANGADSGFGLAGMRERLALAGGSLEVASGNDGTVLTARVPAAVTA